MNLLKKIACVSLLLISGCASVRNEYSLPEQDLSFHTNEPQTRVVFYNGNGFNPLYLDGSWRVGVKINGVGVENLHIGQYVQVFLLPGAYDIELSHIDLFTFRDKYKLEVGSQDIYIRVYNTPVSTKYELQNSEPEKFREKFKPANESIQPSANAPAD